MLSCDFVSLPCWRGKRSDALLALPAEASILLLSYCQGDRPVSSFDDNLSVWKVLTFPNIRREWSGEVRLWPASLTVCVSELSVSNIT